MLNIRKALGFTLLEVVAATVILSVSLVPMIKILPAALSASYKVEIITKCALLAQRQTERMRAQLLESYEDPTTLEPVQCISEATGSDAKYYYQIENMGSTWDSDLNEIEVTVWFDKDEDGRVDADENQVTLATLVANRGP